MPEPKSNNTREPYSLRRRFSSAALAQGLFDPTGLRRRIGGDLGSGRGRTRQPRAAGGTGRALGGGRRPLPGGYRGPGHRVGRLGERPGPRLRRGGPGLVLPGAVHPRRLHGDPLRPRASGSAGSRPASASPRSSQCSRICSQACSTAPRATIPNGAGRLSYPIGYWNGAAALLAVAAVLSAYAATRAPTRGCGRSRRRRSRSRVSASGWPAPGVVRWRWCSDWRCSWPRPPTAPVC